MIPLLCNLLCRDVYIFFSFRRNSARNTSQLIITRCHIGLSQPWYSKKCKTHDTLTRQTYPLRHLSVCRSPHCFPSRLASRISAAKRQPEFVRDFLGNIPLIGFQSTSNPKHQLLSTVSASLRALDVKYFPWPLFTHILTSFVLGSLAVP